MCVSKDILVLEVNNFDKFTILYPPHLYEGQENEHIKLNQMTAGRLVHMNPNLLQDISFGCLSLVRFDNNKIIGCERGLGQGTCKVL